MLYELLSVLGSLIAGMLVLLKPRKLLTLFALAVALFVLFGPYSFFGLIAAGALRIVFPVKK
ncbi:MAG: hypothetical protein ABH803_00235 [Candidatus Micrarchaeota archaeon]